MRPILIALFCALPRTAWKGTSVAACMIVRRDKFGIVLRAYHKLQAGLPASSDRVGRYTTARRPCELPLPFQQNQEYRQAQADHVARAFARRRDRVRPVPSGRPPGAPEKMA